MNDNEIPTPETDAAVKRFVGLSGDRYLVEADVARSLERRLSVARGALGELIDAGGTSLDIVGQDTNGHPLCRDGMARLKARQALRRGGKW